MLLSRASGAKTPRLRSWASTWSRFFPVPVRLFWWRGAPGWARAAFLWRWRRWRAACLYESAAAWRARANTVVQLSVLTEALFEGPSPILERTALGDAHASPEQRYWLLQDLEALLERAALEAPLLVCLDDVQWADSGTAAPLRALPSLLVTVPIGGEVALRPGQGEAVRRDIPVYRQVGVHRDERLGWSPLRAASLELRRAMTSVRLDNPERSASSSRIRMWSAAPTSHAAALSVIVADQAAVHPGQPSGARSTHVSSTRVPPKRVREAALVITAGGDRMPPADHPAARRPISAINTNA